MRKISIAFYAAALFFSNNLNAQELDKECNINNIENNYYKIKCPMELSQEALKDRDYSGQADYEVEAKTNFAAANFAVRKKQKWFLIKDYHSTEQYLKNGKVIYTGVAKLQIGNNKMPKDAQNAKTFIQSAN